MNYANGLVAYEGPSEIDGKPIALIPTGFVLPSHNPKTGPMIQGWIIRTDMSPAEAAKNGEDYSVCGSCPLRTIINAHGKQERKCYVNPFQAPTQVYKTYVAGKYPVIGIEQAAKLLKRKDLRLGAYGDPAAIPFGIIRRLVRHARSITAYTHQWATCDRRLKSLVMASVDSVDEYREAVALGWRTFRIIKSINEPLMPKEIICPATPAGGERVQCIACVLCDGTHPYVRNGERRGDPRKNIVVVAHGKGAPLFRR